MMSRARDLADIADLNFDSGTMVVDKVNDRVGVLNATPAHPFQVGTDDLIVDASGNVGIGTSSPNANSGLTIFSSLYPSLYFDNNSTTGGGAIRFHKQGVQQGLIASTGWILGDTSNDMGIHAGTGNALRFYTNGNNERLRIDSSGNLLVGTTDPLVGSGTGNNTEGFALSAGSYGGYATFSRSAAECLNLNRKTNDGTILNFRKDGSTVGSIGSVAGLYTAFKSNGSNLYLGVNNSLDITLDSTRLRPTSDATMSLGNGTNRFTDLVLSGGVYLGGTGSANLLDSYEEGTWTPAYSTSGGSFTYDSATNGQYTKIGNVVTVYFRIYTLSGTVGTGNVSITGLPFAEAFTNGTLGGSIGDCRLFAGDTPSEIGVYNSELLLWYRTSANGPNTRLQASDLGTGYIDNLIDGQITYITS